MAAFYSDLAGKTVLITGGAHGIGEAMVRSFCDQGAKVYFCDLDAKAGKSLWKSLGESAVFAKVDLCKEAEVRRWIQGVARRSGRIDVLINNAARDPRIKFKSMKVSEWDALFATNLRAYFLTASQAVGHMGQGASIIHFASITFLSAPVAMSAYVATKGGVIGFTRSLARELGPSGIRVNAISPGWIMTERQLKEYVDASTKRLIRRAQCVPDLLQPEEMAEVALFLASDASRAITGQNLLADRGWHHA